MSRSTWVLARSLLFNTLFYANLLVHMIVALPTLVLPYRVLRVFIRSYARTSLWLLRVICGTKVVWRGTENIPRGSCIVACKHQSAWETFALYAVLEDPIYVLKRELMWILPEIGRQILDRGDLHRWAFDRRRDLTPKSEPSIPS